MVARATVRQVFHNPGDRWLEGIYVFPLPERAAVDRLTMLVGERRIEGRILEKAEAERAYRAAAGNGQRASLVRGERPNRSEERRVGKACGSTCSSRGPP